VLSVPSVVNAVFIATEAAFCCRAPLLLGLNHSAGKIVIPTAYRAHKYGNMGTHMKTTIELPDDLFLQAKRKALENRTTLRQIVEHALRQELRGPCRPRPRPRTIRWITSPGGLPPGLDLSDRTEMWKWMTTERRRDRH